MTDINYNFSPNQQVWVVNENRQIKFGSITSVHFDVYKNINSNLIQNLYYKVSIDDTDNKQLKFTEDKIFETIQDALDYLYNILIPYTE
jgi:hypothetical protein